MSKGTKQDKPEQVEIWTRNQDTYYKELENYILSGYTVILDGFLEPTNIAGIMTAHLRLRGSD